MAEELLLAAGWALALVLHVRIAQEREMLARGAHEIRNPLCAAALALDARRLTAAERELRRVHLALDDLGRPSRPRTEAVDVGRLVEASADAWRGLAEVHGARLSVEAPAGTWLQGDAFRLTQAVTNLVANAAEHGGGGEIRVVVEAEGDRIRIVVADSGAGLPPAVAARVGRRGLQGRLANLRRGRRRRGHGLGIVDRVARLHGGRLVARTSTRGAVLVLDLPVGTRGRRRSRTGVLFRRAAGARPLPVAMRHSESERTVRGGVARRSPGPRRRSVA